MAYSYLNTWALLTGVMPSGQDPCPDEITSGKESKWRRSRSKAIPSIPTATCPPWADYRGPLALFAQGGEWFTAHGAFGCRDSLIGALYLVICEVFDAEEPPIDSVLRSHQVLFTVAIDVGEIIPAPVIVG